MIVARADFDPRVGDADQRLAQIVIGEAHGLEHAARRGAAGSIGNSGRMLFQVSHGEFWIFDFGFWIAERSI